jgi:diamine N-acetyltransferase
MIRDASPSDIAVLLPLVREFYLLFGYPFSEERKEIALAQLIADPTLGRVLVGSFDGVPLGYAVVAFSFSLEFDGRTAFVDELFIQPGARGLGLGSRLVRHAAEVCRGLGVNALHLETEDSNADATRLYARLGFRSYGRHLMTLPLSSVPGPKA